MICPKCSFTIKHDQAPPDDRCMMCAADMRRDADDFLLHGAEGLIKDSRAGQVSMARAVEDAISRKSCLLVEGPVGVGKSFAYLIPALLSGKRTIVSTAQKALQQQLGLNDGPRLIKTLKQDVPKAAVVVLKGKANYGCLLHVEHTLDAPEYATWLKHSPSADLSEYAGRRPAKMWDSTAEGCLGTKCPQAAVCGYMKTRTRAKEASVLIVNHALVAFDLRFGPMKLFGEYHTLITDEAHKAPSAFRGAFEETVSNRGFERIVKKMDELVHVAMPVTGDHVKRVWQDTFARATHLEGALQPNPFGSPGEELFDLLEELRVFVDKHSGVLGRSHAENAEDFSETKSSELGLDLSDTQAMLALSRSLHRTTGALKLLKEPTVNTLLTAEKNQGAHKFKATPISVGALVGDKLALIPSLIFTSATMTTEGNFSDFRRQLGLHRLENPSPVTVQPVPAASAVKAGAAVTAVAEPKTITELVVVSPFDYRAQGAFLYIPKHVKTAVPDGFGDPEKREDYLDSIAREILALVRASKGQALVLFTATSDLKGVHERLEAEDSTIPWIAQNIDTGQGAESVLQQFDVTPGGVILGLKSFWEGVSIEGDKLWLVIITKLPFPSPADPLNQAMAMQVTKELTAQGVPLKEQGFATFRKLSLPPMITDIRQGAGRLVRTTTDRGVLAILDTRVWSGKTGVAPDANQQAPRGYGVTVIKALGFTDNWTADFSYVQGKFKQWQRQQAKAP